MFFKKFLFSLILFVVLGFASSTFAQINIGEEVGRQLGAAGASAGFGAPVDPRFGAAQIINYILELVGIVFLILTIYAGFTWMTAGGNQEKVDKAKKLLYNSVLGLIIIVSAYSITYFAVELAWKSKTPRDLPAGIYIEPYGAGAPCPYGAAYCGNLSE